MSICDMIGPILYADELNTRIIVLHFRLIGSVRGPVHRSEILTIYTTIKKTRNLYYY